jgi:hypothetical protein
MESLNHFNIWISSDSMPYYKYTGFRTWFYFAVKGVERGKICHFHIKNMNNWFWYENVEVKEFKTIEDFPQDCFGFIYEIKKKTNTRNK